MIENLLTWKYQGEEIRTVELNNETWWVLADICKVLGLTNPSIAAQRLDDDEYVKVDLYSPKSNLGHRLTLVTNESGLYSLILRSDKEVAKPFRRWITHEVIPAIRQNGCYESDYADDTYERTSSEYMKVAKILSACNSESLPLVVYALRRSGYEIPELERERERNEPRVTDPDLGKIILSILNKYNKSYKWLGNQVGLTGATLGRYVNKTRFPKKSTYDRLVATLEDIEESLAREYGY